MDDNITHDYYAVIKNCEIVSLLQEKIQLTKVLLNYRISRFYSDFYFRGDKKSRALIRT